MATSAAPTVTVKQGELVAVSRYNSRHEIINSPGFVTGVDSITPELQGPNGEPAITVIVVDPDNLQRLGAAQWSAGLLRLTNVVAKGHPWLASRKAVAAYEYNDIQPFLPNLLEAIDPAPSNPIFERSVLPVPPTTGVSHAAAVQAGTIAGPTVVPPTISEVIPATDGAPAHVPATRAEVHAEAPESAPVAETTPPAASAPATPTEPPPTAHTEEPPKA